MKNGIWISLGCVAGAAFILGMSGCASVSVHGVRAESTNGRPIPDGILVTDFQTPVEAFRVGREGESPPHSIASPSAAANAASLDTDTIQPSQKSNLLKGGSAMSSKETDLIMIVLLII